MRQGKFFYIIIVWGVLGAVSASWAQTGSRFKGATSGREADFSVVNVYGPDELTELAGQAIQEKRPDVAIVEYYKPLKNKVWIEGTAASEYMPLSLKRAGILQAARARGESVYSALSGEQKGVIKRTVGMKKVARGVERKKYRAETRKYYVRLIYPPPPVVYFPGAGVGLGIGGYYPFYGYRSYGGWEYGRYPYYRGW